jgi:hypothetical protein
MTRCNKQFLLSVGECSDGRRHGTRKRTSARAVCFFYKVPAWWKNPSVRLADTQTKRARADSSASFFRKTTRRDHFSAFQP